jgi:hypothetical protein
VWVPWLLRVLLPGSPTAKHVCGLALPWRSDKGRVFEKLMARTGCGTDNRLMPFRHLRRANERYLLRSRRLRIMPAWRVRCTATRKRAP